MNTLFFPGSRYDFIIPVLGIAPLLMVTDTVEKGAAIGVINLLVMVFVGLIVSAIRNLLPRGARLTAILIINATVVSLVLFLVQLWFFEFSKMLGIYIPLIAMSCLVLVMAEEYALRNGVIKSVIQVFIAGTEILIVLVVLAITREYSGLTLLKQPAGAFLLLGLMLAVCSLNGKKHDEQL